MTDTDGRCPVCGDTRCITYPECDMAFGHCKPHQPQPPAPSAPPVKLGREDFVARAEDDFHLRRSLTEAEMLALIAATEQQWMEINTSKLKNGDEAIVGWYTQFGDWLQFIAQYSNGVWWANGTQLGAPTHMRPFSLPPERKLS